MHDLVVLVVKQIHMLHYFVIVSMLKKMYSCTEQLTMKNAYETQLVQLEELIVQQRKQVQTLKNAFDDIEQRCALVQKDKFRFLDKKNRLLFLDDSRTRKLKKEKIRLQIFQNQLLIAQEEKFQLRNEVINHFI